MARSLQQQLDDCDARIAAIEDGAQAYTIRGKNVQHALLKDLYEERRRLHQYINAGATQFASLGQLTRPS